MLLHNAICYISLVHLALRLNTEIYNNSSASGAPYLMKLSLV